jgi:hypothetical protein
MGRGCGRWLSVTLLLLACGLAPGESPAALNYTCTWVGNSYGGLGGKHWGNYTEAFFVTPSGECLTNTPWEEHAREFGRYREADVLPTHPELHGWGRLGGYAITANATHIFLTMQQDASSVQGGTNAQGQPRYPQAGQVWHALRRYTLDGRPSGFTGGWGYDASMRVVHTGTGALRGIAASASEVFVSDAANHRVQVYDTNGLQWKRSFPFTRPGAMRLDRDGNLWIVQRAEAAIPPAIRKVGPSGQDLGVRLVFPASVELNDIGYDNFNGAHRLLVPDHGVDQRVRIYRLADLAGDVSQPLGYLGVKNGILSSEGALAGTAGPGRFMNPVGCGVDAQGDYYVAQRQTTTWGLVIEKYKRSNHARLWQGYGLEFVDNAQSDPWAETEVFTKDSQYVLDYGKPAGQEASWRGYTVNRFKYPQDSRLHRMHPYLSQVRRIQDRRFLVLSEMHMDSFNGLLQFYRFNAATDGLVAIPSTRYAKREQYSWGLFVDFRGAVWEAGHAVHRTPLNGLDAQGNPVFGATTTWPRPAPFTSLQRVEYDATRDVLHLAGYTAASGGDGGNWGMVGKVYARYNNWTQKQTPDVVINLPWNAAAAPKLLPKSMATFDKYLFVAEFQGQGKVWIYNTETGATVGTLTPKSPAGYQAWVDVPYGVRATRRTNGEYLVFLEDDAQAKVLLYRWTP